MVHPSKIFIEPFNCYHCSQFILHPGIGCFQFFLKNLLRHGLGGLKYFTPLLITPLVLKYKFMNRKLFYQTLKHYLQTVFWSTLATASIFLWICYFRNIFGKLRICTSLFLPTVLGLQFSWFFPPRVMKLFSTATTQAALEGLLIQNSNKLTHLILHSSSVQTLLFMLNSAIILHYKSKNIYNEFWFIETIKKSNETTTKITPDEEKQNQSDVSKDSHTSKTSGCDHRNATCGRFALDGMKSYLFYGIPLDFIGVFMKKNLNQGPKTFMAKAKGKLGAFRPYMTAFFLSYVGIYRLSSCLLRKYYSHLSLDLQHVTAAFLGGLSYMFVKRRNFVLFSLVISAQLLYQQFCNSISRAKLDKKQNIILMLLKNVPRSQIFLSVSCGYLVHHYIFNLHLVNSLARGFLDGLTDNKLKTIHSCFTNNDMQSLIEMAKLYPVKKVFL